MIGLPVIGNGPSEIGQEDDQAQLWNLVNLPIVLGTFQIREEP